MSSGAASNCGFSAYFKNEWFADKWPRDTQDISVPVKEMIPVVIAAELWGHLWARKRVLFRSDNLSVVSTLQSGLCRARHLALCFREFSTRAVLNISPSQLSMCPDGEILLLTLFHVSVFRTSDHLSPMPIQFPHRYLKLYYPSYSSLLVLGMEKTNAVGLGSLSCSLVLFSSVAVYDFLSPMAVSKLGRIPSSSLRVNYFTHYCKFKWLSHSSFY